MIYMRPRYNLVISLLLMCGAYGLLKCVGFGIMEVGLAWAAILYALYLMVDWWMRNRSEERVRELEQEARGEDLLIMEIFSKMSVEQIGAMAETRVVWRHVYPRYGEPKHLAQFPAGMNQAAEAFSRAEVLAVWGVCNEYNFAPLSTWTEGTRNRKCAQAMYEYFLARNWLVPWSGPNPAIWKEDGYEKAGEDLFGRSGK